MPHGGNLLSATCPATCLRKPFQPGRLTSAKHQTQLSRGTRKGKQKVQLYSSGKKTKRHASLGTASRAAGVLRGDFCAQRLRSPRLSRGGREKRPLHAHPCPLGTWGVGEDPAAGGGALEGEANTGEYGKQSPVLRRTDPSRASGRGRLWFPERPSSTPGLSLLSGGAHLRPVPAAPSPRPGPRGPLGGGALGPAAVIAGPRPGRAWAAARTRSRASAGTAA